MKTETAAKIDSCLNVVVSCFANYNAPDNPKPVNLLQWLTSDKYRTQVEAIRAAPTKEERDRLKAGLPAITPSGQFSRREEGALIRHSGFICIDIDLKGNEHLGNYSDLKGLLSRLQNVAFVGLSVSGTGFFLLIPIAHPERHKAHFRALKNDFARLGITIDSAPANPASLRGYSWDAAPYFNHAAKPYLKFEEEAHRPPETYRPAYGAPRPQSSEAQKVEAILQAQEARRVDITSTYSNWFAIGCALANEFGEAGREYFHRASQFYPKYNRQETDKQFDACRKNYSYTLGTFFRLAEDAGLRWKDSLQGEAAPQSKPIPPPKVILPHSAPNRATDSDLPPGFRIVEFEHGQTLEVDGLPVQWLNEKEHAAAMKRLGTRGQLAAMIALNPAVSQLVEAFALALEN